MIKDDYKGKILQTFRPFLKMNLPAYFFAQLCPLSRDEILVFRQTPLIIYYSDYNLKTRKCMSGWVASFWYIA